MTNGMVLVNPDRFVEAKFVVVLTSLIPKIEKPGKSGGRIFRPVAVQVCL